MRKLFTILLVLLISFSLFGQTSKQAQVTISQQITADVTDYILDWEADRGINVADGAEIGTGNWLDQSSSHNDPLNAAVSGKPIYRATGGPGGRPTVEFTASGGSATNSFFNLTTALSSTADWTMFAVMVATDTNPRTIVSGPTAAFQWRINSSKQNILSSGTTDYGSGSATLSTSAFTQINVTFVHSTRAFVFRAARAADGSGTGGGASPISNSTQMARNDANVVTREPFLGKVSMFRVYNRILTGSEIATVEAMILARWGV